MLIRRKVPVPANLTVVWRNKCCVVLYVRELAWSWARFFRGISTLEIYKQRRFFYDTSRGERHTFGTLLEMDDHNLFTIVISAMPLL